MENKGNEESRSLHNDLQIRRKYFPLDKTFLKQKYIKEHLSCQSIANIVGEITRQGIWKALKRNGIKPRSKNDAIFYDEHSNRCKLFLGYFWIYRPDHPRAYHNYVKRATLNLEKKLGRFLEKGEFAHHIDGNRLNDDPANLEVTNRSEHFVNHLLLGTKESRKKDYTLKARRLCGNDVLRIRSMRKCGMLMQDIANHFQVGRTTVSNVINGVCWGYIQS